MIGALWTGISGLAGQQTALDNESHNIANVNTVGYKASRISFADQIYQDKIGKGSKVLDAEKLFVQGNTKNTGVAYDMALSGSGFFSVVNRSASGTSETYYTRAGNFRMGDNGTLQDSAGNEVQGWAMADIDPDSDVVSTNPNVNVFTSDYTKLVSSKVVQYSNYVETVTAKTTDYEKTANADSSTVFTGSGLKTKSAKVADVEALVTNYNNWLKKLQDDPNAASASSTAQKTQIKFEGTDFKKEGDQIYVYINGTKYEQNFVSVVATEDADGDGIGPGSSAAEQAEDNLAASRAATYKALADKISEIPGMVAYTVEDSSNTGTYGVFESTDTFTPTTAGASGTGVGDSNALLGMIEIRSLIPGEEFTVTEVAEISGNLTVQGQINTTSSATAAIMGSGIGAVESAKLALAKATTGSQRDVFSPSDLTLGEANITGGTLNGEEYNFEFVVYDKDTKQNVTVGPISISGADNVDDIVADLIQGGTTATPAAAADFNKYFNVENINGNLVISTNDANYDVEFSTTLTAVNKAFDSSKTISASQEVLTFDKDFKPAPDGTKSYQYEWRYEEDMPVTSGIGTSVVATDTTPGAFPEDYTLRFTFNDVNDSLGRGGGNQTLEITVPSGADEVALATALQTQLNALSPGEFTVAGVAGTSLTLTHAGGETISALELKQVHTGTSGAAVTPADISALATDVDGEAEFSATVDADGNLQVTLLGSTNSGLEFVLKETGTNQVIEKNAEFSGREGAGAEFIEIVNTIDQTSSQGSLQLRLDTLGISDSAFGEFRVDDSGIIYMKQDGAEFAIGQVSVALFNNERGLEAIGDNLYAKTTSSGEPIHNINNDRTAKIEGKTLELSSADLSESLVNLMVFQRAFEANAKTITTSDALLNTLINLKR